MAKKINKPNLTETPLRGWEKIEEEYEHNGDVWLLTAVPTLDKNESGEEIRLYEIVICRKEARFVVKRIPVLKAFKFQTLDYLRNQLKPYMDSAKEWIREGN